MIDILLSYGADIGALDESGRPPLECAAEAQADAAFAMLAYDDAVDESSQTP